MKLDRLLSLRFIVKLSGKIHTKHSARITGNVLQLNNFQCIIQSISGPYFPAFGVNTEGVPLRIQSECGKIWTRKTSNTD